MRTRLSRLSTFALFTSLLSIGTVTMGCAPRIERGSPCARSSECPTPTVCIDGRCLEECEVQDDCPIGARCLDVNGQGRCLFEEENVCAGDGDCGDPLLVCRAGHCFNTCDRCAELGAVCESDVCVRVVGLDVGPEIDAGSDAGRDGGGGPIFEGHQTCIDGMDCDPGQQCVSDDGAASVCRDPCVGPVPDAGAPPPDDRAECASWRCVRPADDFTNAYCALTCDPLDAESCPVGEACDRLPRLRPTTGAETLVWGCRRVLAPPSEVDGPCTTSEPEVCPAGTRCMSDDGGATPAGHCLPFCDSRMGTCAGGRTCVSLHDDQYTVGICARPSADAGPGDVDAGTDAGP